MDSRYQFQKWYVKCYRWLRWKPWYAMLALYFWFFGKYLGYPRYSLSRYWSISMGLADLDMKHYYTLEETINILKNKP